MYHNDPQEQTQLITLAFVLIRCTVKASASIIYCSKMNTQRLVLMYILLF